MESNEQLLKISEEMRKVAEELRSYKPEVKLAYEELDTQQVLNFIRFFGAAHE